MIRALGQTRGYVVAAAATSAGTGLLVAIDHASHIPNISLLYIPVILVVAVYFGTWPSLVAAGVAFLEYDFFLLQPIFTFTIRQAEDILAFAVFAVVAILTSQLAAQARQRAETAQRRADESLLLYELGRDLMTAHDVQRVLQTITGRIVEVFGVDRCAIFATAAGDVQELLASATARNDPGSSVETVNPGLDRRIDVPLRGPAHSSREPIYVPLRASNEVIGLMEIGLKHGGSLDTEERRLLTSFAAQIALVIDRARTEEERRRLQVLEESDRLKSALLNAVSHDLRTPLSSIKTSATSLLLDDSGWTPDERRELLLAIDHEADRLNRLVGNLLDLSRMQAGVLQPERHWYDVREIVDTLAPRLPALLVGRHLELTVEPGIPDVYLDLVRVEEAVMNLVENAVKYSPPGTPIELKIGRSGDTLHISVSDHGPGVTPEHRDRIFDAFYRADEHGDRKPGTGLGLAICRGIVEAHGGSIDVESAPGGGATFTLSLPLAPTRVAV